MQETIAEVVYGAIFAVDAVSQEDRELFREMYAEYIEDGLIDERGEEEEVLGYEFDRDNSDFAGRIVGGLIDSGEVKQDDGPKAFKIVKAALDDYPRRMINGRMQNYFEGSPDDFAVEVSEKIERGLEKKGLLSRVKGLFGGRV